MSINYEMARYTELTGEDGTKVSISRLGGYLDGYDKGREDAIDEFKERLLDLCDGGEECFDCVGGNCTGCLENSVDYSSIVDLAEELKEKKE